MWKVVVSVLLLSSSASSFPANKTITIGDAADALLKDTKYSFKVDSLDVTENILHISESLDSVDSVLHDVEESEYLYKSDETRFHNVSRSELNWEKLMDFLKLRTSSAIHSLDILDVISAVNINDDCRQSLSAFIVSLSEWEKWAVMMADANGKIPGGVLEGTTMDVGSLEECLKIKVTSDNGTERFRGRYCMVGYKSPLLSSIHQEKNKKKYLETYGEPPEWIEDFVRKSGKYLQKISFYLGTCVPSTCTKEDVLEIASHVVGPLGLKVHVPACQVDEPKIWTVNGIVALSFLGLVVFLCFCGTIIDIVGRYSLEDQNTLRSKCTVFYLLRMFSLYLNSEKFFGRSKVSSNLSFFNGMRFISFTWVVINHTWAVYGEWRLLSYRGFLALDDEVKGGISFKIIESAHVAVDTFFFISGFLLVYTAWRKLEISRGQFSVFKFMMQKYWRLTPAIGTTIALFLIFDHYGSGPIYKASMSDFSERCYTHWWSNFLYINNWWSIDKMCLPHTWFLAALMQSHLIGVIVLLIAYRYPFIGILLGSVIAVGTCIVLALINIWNNHPMPTFFLLKDLDFKYDFLHKVHFQTYSHINSYLIGMAVGFLFLKFNERKITVKYKIYGWTVAAILALYVFEGKYCAADDRQAVAFYSAIHRTAWALSIGWVTSMCAMGHGGIVNRFLSWHGFDALSNISYLAYLLHILVICYRHSTMRERFAYGEIEMVFEIVLVTVSGCLLSVIAYITVEMPFSTLASLVFRK